MIGAMPSAPELLALHGVRILGYSTAGQVAARYDLDAAVVSELLLDAEARGWVRRYQFAGRGGWSLTDAGRAENERRLAAELDALGARAVVSGVHTAFLPLNRRLAEACTRWQIRPVPWDRMAANDHSDWRWDEGVLRSLSFVGRELARITAPLVDVLPRFGGHVERYRAALVRAERGEQAWVDAPDLPSCHIVWIQLHEDLLATLGIERGTDGAVV
jgi:hypothetical protein